MYIMFEVFESQWHKTPDKKKNFSAGATHLAFNLNWFGFRNQFEFKTINGNLSFRVDDFLIKEVDDKILGSSDFLKLISLFNVSKTFGDLTNLNFREKFNSGFQANRVEGDLEIDSEKIQTKEPIVFSSGSGVYKWYGQIGRSKEGNLENLNFEIVISFKIKEEFLALCFVYLTTPLSTKIWENRWI